MSFRPKYLPKAALLVALSALVAFSGSSVAAPLALPNLPLFLPDSVPPLNMMVLGRDHKLYYEAYNDHSDLDDDGKLDVGYKPAAINYYGYFDSFKCYDYNSGRGRFDPSTVTADKKCSKQWSGDFLNYVTTARIDALRKVLYGGYRSTDTTSTTLERTHIPQDAHSWGKEYESVARDGYDIRDYTPLDLPGVGLRHLFANTTPLNTTSPLMRVLTNQGVRIWNWLSIERPVAGTQVVTGVNGGGGEIRTDVTPTDYQVRVRVCVTGMLEANCERYPDGRNKPTGLLQEFGENDSMYFGLITGSYAKNTSGGVLRSAIGSIKDEINPTTGQFLNYDGTNGILATLNRLRTTGFGGSYEYSCGWNAAARVINEGECQMWGNPIAEMMYEGLRYFSGRGSATPAFSTTFGQGEERDLPGGGLPVASWNNPYEKRPVCSKPFETVISDINPSYDTDQLPGSAFTATSPITDDLPGGMNVADIGQKIFNQEIKSSGDYFIGQSGSVSDGAPTPKTVTSLGNIRGLAPEEPTKQGGYYSASVAHFGRTHDINPGAAGEQKVNTFAVALASPLPQIEIPVKGRKVTLVPFAKSVGGAFGITANKGEFQPTNQIVDFYVDTLSDTSGRFRVNFEDVEQGADHDMDAIVVYDYKVNADDTVTVSLDSEYAAGGIIHHLGFVISGTTEDGIYLGVRDRDTAAGSDPDYFLDTPNVPGAMPLTYSHTFSVGSSSSAGLLKDPLWYAAKWGGFDESFRDPADRNDIPDSDQEWDKDAVGQPGHGQPDNYFLVTNALKLSAQLRSAFEDILRRTTSSSSASVNSGSISSETRVFQARFNTGEWTGELLSYELNPTTGAVKTPAEWDAAKKLPAADARNIITVNTSKGAIPFRWDNLDKVQQKLLDADDDRSKLVLDFLRGDGSNEGQGTGQFRERPTKLGDIVSSSPLFVGRPPFRYRDSLEAEPYSEFATEHKDRQGMVYAGANDGMLHGFDAGPGANKGKEVFAFVPSVVFPNLKKLSQPGYNHQFYVDGATSMGDVFFGGDWHTVLAGGLNKGGQEIYALDVTSPSKLANAEGNASEILLWEFTDRDDADLGLTYSQPSIVKVHNSGSQWAAVFGNGYNNSVADGHPSTTGNAVLYVVDIRTGAVLAKLDTHSGIADDPTGAGRDNGLATPALVDIDGDRIVDYAYAGDLFGNMWKFDLTSKDSSKWKVAFKDGADKPLPLFKAVDASGNSQPITVRPEVARGPAGAGMIVLFGTGKYLEPSDKLLNPERQQSFYGIVDRNSGTSTDIVDDRGHLTRQRIIGETTFDPDGPDPDGDGPLTGGIAPIKVRASTKNGLGANSGWYIDLVSPVLGYQGEKQVSNPIVRNGNVVFTTLIPDADPCKFGGGSWIMELSLLSGSRLEKPPFDLNGDGQFTDDDLVEFPLPDGTKIKVPVSGIGSEEGILQSPGVIEAEIGPNGEGKPVQFKYLPGSSGGIQRVTENPGAGGTGRQSWRQIR